MDRPVIAAMLMLFWSVAAAAEPEIRTDDVARFYAVYDAHGGRPSAALRRA